MSWLTGRERKLKNAFRRIKQEKCSGAAGCLKFLKKKAPGRLSAEKWNPEGFMKRKILRSCGEIFRSPLAGFRGFKWAKWKLRRFWKEKNSGRWVILKLRLPPGMFWKFLRLRLQKGRSEGKPAHLFQNMFYLNIFKLDEPSEERNFWYKKV